MPAVFGRQYGEVGRHIQAALRGFCEEVASQEFPGEQYSPYSIPEPEAASFAELLERAGLSDAASGVHDMYTTKTK